MIFRNDSTLNFKMKMAYFNKVLLNVADRKRSHIKVYCLFLRRLREARLWVYSTRQNVLQQTTEILLQNAHQQESTANGEQRGGHRIAVI